VVPHQQKNQPPTNPHPNLPVNLLKTAAAKPTTTTKILLKMHQLVRLREVEEQISRVSRQLKAASTKQKSKSKKK
jgi:hypothetical protein